MEDLRNGGMRLKESATGQLQVTSEMTLELDIALAIPARARKVNISIPARECVVRHNLVGVILLLVS